jgi:hypothetical protein
LTYPPEEKASNKRALSSFEYFLTSVYRLLDYDTYFFARVSDRTSLKTMKAYMATCCLLMDQIFSAFLGKG